MRHLTRRLGRLALACAAAAAFAGCSISRGGDDVYDRIGNHMEWHTLQYWKDMQQAHEVIDRYFFNRDMWDPDDYGTGAWK